MIPSKRTPSHPRFGLLILATLVAPGISTTFAQTKSDTPAVSTEDDSVVLSPFTVTSNKDIGFVAASALAGGRMSTSLKDTPVAYSVQTAEFLQAFNLTDVSDAAQWTVNSNLNEGDNTYKGFGTSAVGQVAVRGIKVNNPTVNFFTTSYTLDAFSIDRIDYARGPNAVLFGAGGIGATINTVTKQALPDKEVRQAQVLLGSYNRFRFVADINQPFANKKGAVRTNVVWEESDTWRDLEWAKKHGIALQATYKLTPNLSIRGEAEYLERSETRALMSMTEQVSGWDGVTSTSFGTLGKPVITGTNTLTTGLSAAQRAAYGVGGGGSANGTSGTLGQRFVTSSVFGLPDELMNMQRYFYTSAANQNNTLANSGRINGVAIVTPGLNMGAYAMIDGGGPADRYTRALAGSPNFFVPSRTFTPMWSNQDKPTYVERARNASVTLNYNLGRDLYFQIAANSNRVHIMGNTDVRRQLEVAFIDVNKNLPNGDVNPGYLHPYVEFLEYQNPRDYINEALHVQGVYKKDTKIGRLQLSLIGGANSEQTIFRARTLILPIQKTLANGNLPTGGATLDARTWLDSSNAQFTEWGVWNRLYLDQPNRSVGDPSLKSYKVVNGISGITEEVRPTWMYDATREDNNRDTAKEYKFFQTAGNLDLFKNRLILIGAFRRDFTYLAENRIVAAGDQAAGWDGNSLKFRPSAPSDYFQLMYNPKNAAGVITGPSTPADVRPRTVVNGVSLGQPQYANDRFKNDYNAPELNPTVNTFTVGGVGNITSALGVYYNVSQSFSLLTAQPTVDGTLLSPTASQGTDYGVRYTLPNGRLSVNLGRFVSHQSGAGGLLPGNFSTDYNSIYNLAPLGPTAATDTTLRNDENIANFPTNVYDTSTSESSGYEMEVTANPLPGWRVTANAGYTDTYDHDKNPRMVAYFAAADATARSVLQAGGITIDSANVAAVQAKYTDATAVGYDPAMANNAAKSTVAVNAWNDIQTNLIPNNPATAIYQPRTGVNKWSGNVAMDYTFQYGRFKGLRLGTAVRMRSGQVVGYRGSDTIVDPSNPARAIDDPSVDASTPVIANGYFTVNGTLHYEFRTKNRHLIQIDLFVDNLLDNKKPIFGNNGLSNAGATLFAPRNGSITDPSRITVPGAYSYLAPRSYSIAVKMDF